MRLKVEADKAWQQGMRGVKEGREGCHLKFLDQSFLVESVEEVQIFGAF